MDNSIIIGLLQNTAILLSFSMLYENLWMKKEASRKLYRKLIIGFILGGIGIVIMFTPWKLGPGLIFDTRSVMLSVSGMFFGGTPTLIAMIITGTTRAIQGGDGVWMGLSVIASSGTIGILWNKFRPGWKKKNYLLELLTMGLIVHLIMAGCTVFLPSAKIWNTLKTIALPLLLIYTPATMLLGMLMLRQSKNWKNRLAKEKLRESERRFNTLLDTGNLVTVILDRKGNILFCNKYLLDISKYSHDEIIGRNWFHVFIPDESRDKINRLFNQIILQKGSARNIESEMLTKDGEILYISWFIMSMKSENPEGKGLVGIGANITGHKQLEIKLKEKNSEIESRNLELTEKNKELILAKQKAEESDYLKSAFLQNMSHEIRTPMNAIIGFSGLLNKKGLTEEKRATYTSIISGNTKQLLAIVNDILTISSIDAKQEKINNSEFSVKELLEELHFTLTPLAAQKNILFKYITHDDIQDYYIYTDKTKLTQILTNLIGNAIKFTSEGAVEFGYLYGTDKHDYGAQQKNRLTFFVKDSGIGIPEEMHEKIFERFRQADSTISARFGGTGLGLSISKAYVEMLGGKIWINSEPGKGSVFNFSLDCIPSISADEPISYSTGNNAESPIILVAEDEKNSFLLLSEILETLSLKFLWAKNGIEAVNLCESNPDIKLVLMDLKMPLMDGFKASEKIKQIRPSLPVIIQSAWIPENEIHHLKENTFDDYIMKPIIEAELRTKIPKFLGK